MDRSIAQMRREYGRDALREQDMLADPIRQFARWFEQARQSGILEPNAMTLATVDARDQPAVRIVLLKDFSERGFVFFTNYESDKARQIAVNPRVALLFYWDRLERSVRISGTADKVSRQENEAYFATRPHASKLGAWISHQSRRVIDRGELEARLAELALRYPEGSDVPCPPFWGGYCVQPRQIEFWQGQHSRLHDRLRYVRDDGGWRIERLAP